MRVEGRRQVCEASVPERQLLPLWNEIDVMAERAKSAFFDRYNPTLNLIPTPNKNWSYLLLITYAYLKLTIKLCRSLIISYLFDPAFKVRAA